MATSHFTNGRCGPPPRSEGADKVMADLKG